MTDHTLADAMRVVVDHRFPDLAYNIGFALKDADLGMMTVSWHTTKKVAGIGVKHVHHERQEAVENWCSGANVEYSHHWVKSTGERGGTTAYTYRPPTKDAGKVPSVTFYNLRMTDIDDAELRPAESVPVGPAHKTVYTLRNDSPHRRDEDYEVEDESAKESEKTFGWLVSEEFEVATRVSGGVEISAEVSARLTTRVESHGDSRFENRDTHRSLLRGTRHVSPYGQLLATVEDQLVRVSQPIIMTGVLDASVYVVAEDPHARCEWTSLGALFDTMRGFGGGEGALANWWGSEGHALSEARMQTSFLSHRPICRLELRPHDTLTVSRLVDEHEEAYPGREEEYQEYKRKPGETDDGGGW